MLPLYSVVYCGHQHKDICTCGVGQHVMYVYCLLPVAEGVCTMTGCESMPANMHSSKEEMCAIPGVNSHNAMVLSAQAATRYKLGVAKVSTASGMPS